MKYSAIVVICIICSLDTHLICQEKVPIFNEVLSGAYQPTHIEGLDSCLYFSERTGRIKFVPDLNKDSTIVFLDLRQKIDTSTTGRGLFGFTFHPEYPDTPSVYTHYVIDSPGTTIDRTILSRFTIDSIQLADPGSERIILDYDHHGANHHGGSPIFGADGLLYLAKGDRGFGIGKADGQDTSNLFSAVLRIDPFRDDYLADERRNYGIPSDNPFIDMAGADEIWAFGLRSPWKMTRDLLTDSIYLADVGDHDVEEVDVLSMGANFGWSCMEGDSTVNHFPCLESYPITPPLFTYDHSYGCSITGGYVYRGTEIEAFRGHYFFGDFCTGNLWSMDVDNDFGVKLYRTDVGRITSFGQTRDGEMYVASFDKHKIYKLSSVDCPVSQSVSTIHQPIYLASSHISSDALVDQDVAFKAADSVHLETPFSVLSGIELEIVMDNCFIVPE